MRREPKTTARSGGGRRAASSTSAGATPAPWDAAWLVSLLQAGDSFYPTGSYAHSFGLESLVQENVVRDRETLRRFIFLSTLPALRQVELPLAAHAWRALARPDWDRIGEICRLSSALKTAREARQAAENIGRQRAELMANLRGNEIAQEFLRRAAAEQWPHSPAVSAALEGRAFGAPLPAVMAGIAYASISALLAAAMKLLRLGQNASQSLLTEALDAAAGLMASAEATRFEDIGWFNPWLDIGAARHETAEARMFIS